LQTGQRSNPKGLCEATLCGHTTQVTCLNVLSDKRIISGSIDGCLKVWNAITKICETTLALSSTPYDFNESINCIAILPDGRVASGLTNGFIMIWNLFTKKVDVRLIDHDAEISCMTVLSDGRIVTGSEDKTIKIWS
jgi:WD40 repeat protein